MGKMNSEITKHRIKSIRRLINKKGINSLIITKPANVTYTTGFSGEDSWAIITQRNIYLLTDSRYIEQAKKQCPYCKIIQRSGPVIEATANIIKKQGLIQTIAVEKSISLSHYEALKKQIRTGLKSRADIIETVRSIKDSSEIAAVRKACRIAARALGQTTKHIKPGITENELAGMLNFQIRKSMAGNSFETIIAFGSNASLPHHQPSSRKLKKNDTVLIDFGVRYKNYCCDLTRCFSIGKPSRLYERVYEAVRLAQEAAIKKIKAGVRVSEVDNAARKIIAEYNLPVYGHGTGHGLGLEVHEKPIISDKDKGSLKAGQVITIEPGVYIPGKLGVRIEDDILVTQSGGKVLSSSLAVPAIAKRAMTLNKFV